MSMCETCTAEVPERFIFGKVVYHPVNRPCMKTGVPQRSNAPSEEVWRKIEESRKRICDESTVDDPSH